MRNHLFRPALVAVGFVALVLLARHFIVPDDFGIHGRNFTYGFFRLSSVQEWRDLPTKYQGRESCAECHEEEVEHNMTAKHRLLQCENCHGPALDHPDDPELLAIDRSRELCLRCHTALPYPASQRGDLPGIDPESHYPDAMCSECHNPHNPDL